MCLAVSLKRSRINNRGYKMIKLSDNEIQILGRPNFACAQVAKFLISRGIYEDKAKKAEYEQAVYIHWAMNLLEEFGDDWSVEGDKIIKKLFHKDKQ